MYIAYVDDAGDLQATVNANTQVTPVFAFGGVVLDAATLPQLTREFLALKRRHFLSKMRSAHLLDDVLVEIKGTDVRAMVRGNHRERRTAFRFLHDVLVLLEAYDARVLGRVWVKGLNQAMDGRAVNGYSIQAVCRTFHHFLDARDSDGLVVIDSSSPGINAGMAHSIFTRRFRAAGDEYARLIEMPTFGHSKNHAGLQIADLVMSGLVAPLSARAYCVPTYSGVQVHPRYDELKARFGRRLRLTQHRYYADGRWQGGVTVSDGISHRNGSHLYHSICDPAGCRD